MHGAKDNLALGFSETPEIYRQWRKKNKVNRLPVALQEWISNEQPFNRPDGLRSRLHLLNKLWNGDKHRVPMLMGGAMAAGQITSSGKIHAKVSGLCCPLEDGDEVIAFRAVGAGEAKVDPKLTVDVAFEKRSNPKQANTFLLDSESGSARRFLWNTHSHILSAVLPVFEPLLCGH